jgi:MFS transporter, putative metabolite:H+ symporter
MAVAAVEDFHGSNPVDHARLFDFLMIGFVLAFFVKYWHLTYGQSALILFSSGIAAVPGAIFFGWLGDRIGRRKVFLMTILTFSFATGAMALTPDRGWIYLTVMRFIVGVGVVGVAAVDMPLLQKFVPAAKRGLVSGLCRLRLCLAAGCWQPPSPPISARSSAGAGCSR